MTIPAPTTTTAAPIVTFCHIFMEEVPFVATACLPALDGNHVQGKTRKSQSCLASSYSYALLGLNVSPGRPQVPPLTNRRWAAGVPVPSGKEHRFPTDSKARTS